MAASDNNGTVNFDRVPYAVNIGNLSVSRAKASEICKCAHCLPLTDRSCEVRSQRSMLEIVFDAHGKESIVAGHVELEGF